MSKNPVKTAYVYDEKYGWINVSLFITTAKAKLENIEKQLKLNGCLKPVKV
ncbi:hypothetical protein [Pelotomaculum propionicicum]|uniref:Uncharacterized protein n=1 Tax=Pelotomaculum propionicicum TaxID=258475 RepID=A0A4Y7RC48_9FIRM|nr:hypothetical protein [Pelotomaculum propionicicum]TEB06293.1 hypothetical protein Pmgp_03789 [Pelotomaculum propionicicum]